MLCKCLNLLPMYTLVVGYQILLNWKLHLSKSTSVWKDVAM